jgi:homoserine kinase type II
LTPVSLLDVPRSLADAYGLVNARVLSELESYGNENFLIEDGGGQRYVLRRHRLNADIRRIEFQLALQDHLASHAFPTSTVVETASHHRVTIDDDGVPWVLFTHVAGNEYDFERPEQAIEAARSLAQFHRITESFQYDAPPPEYKASIRQCWANAKDDLVALASLFEADGVHDELAYLSRWWESILREWPLGRLDALPSGWLHGDFHGRNLAFDDDEIVGLFDFDDVNRGPYVHDVAAGALKFGREGRGLLTIRPDVARAFVEGYAAVRPISKEERAALPVMVAMGHPPHPQNYRYWRRRGEDIAPRFRREVATMRALDAEMERIGPELFVEDCSPRS